MPSFEQRIFVAEAMDAHDADTCKLERSYRQLATINRYLSRMQGLLRQHLLAPAARAGPSPTLLEVGCGGGDVLRWLAGTARRVGIPLRLFGIDADPRAVALARAILADFPEATVWRAELADLENDGTTADYVFCNHVLHHVPPSEIVAALRSLRRAANHRLLVSDLERSRSAYALFSIFARLVFRRSFVYADGRLSIRKGFRLPELVAACRQAEFPDTSRIFRLSPWRLVIVAPGERRDV